jgi:hypothetical protein
MVVGDSADASGKEDGGRWWWRERGRKTAADSGEAGSCEEDKRENVHGPAH